MDAGVGPSGTACCLSGKVTCNQRLGGGREGGRGWTGSGQTPDCRQTLLPLLCEPENRASRSRPD